MATPHFEPRTWLRRAGRLCPPRACHCPCGRAATTLPTRDASPARERRSAQPLCPCLGLIPCPHSAAASFPSQVIAQFGNVGAHVHVAPAEVMCELPPSNGVGSLSMSLGKEGDEKVCPPLLPGLK